MKKLLFFAAATAVVLSSCSENEVLETPDALKSEIQLSTYVGTTTKATAITYATFNKFTLYAYEHTAATITALPSSAYISDTAVTRATTTAGAESCTFSSSATYYWPSSGYLSFYAFSPSVDSNGLVYTASTEAAAPTLEYTVPTTANTQIDLLVAAPVTKACTTSNTDAVALAFTHALTQIQFSISGTGTAFDYYVKSISINNVVNKNTLTFSSTPSWATLTATGETDYPYYALAAVAKTATGVESPGTSSATTVTGTNGVLMLLPQPAGVEIEIEYYVTEKGDTTPISSYLETDAKTVTTTAAWSAAQNINYVLVLTNDASPITLTASVTEWATTASAGTVGFNDQYAATATTLAGTEDGLAAAIATLNGYAGTNSDEASRNFTVSASEIETVDASYVINIESLGDTLDFEVNDTIAITFGTNTNIDGITITDSDTSIQFNSATDGDTVTFTVGEQL